MSEDLKPSLTGSVSPKGFNIYYEYFGERNRPVMVIFNGVAMETHSWYKLVPLVLPKMDVLLWDYRGQGRSDCDDVPYSVEELPACLIAIIDELGLEKKNIHLLGVSTGSIVVAETLRQFESRVQRAVFSGVLLQKSMTFKLDSEFGIHVLRDNRVDLWAEALYTKILSDGFMLKAEQAIPAMRTALFERYKNRPHALARIIEAQSGYLWQVDQHYPEFARIQIPLMIMAGAEDKLVPPFYQKRVVKMFADVRYSEYEDCAHIPFIEYPAKAFAECIEFFLHSEAT